MMRLIKNGLMFGNLIEVSAPGMVARYNRALKHLTGKETKLTEFHVDISGYSPEIGHELSDDWYLNPEGCNQQFILLSAEQKTAPLISTKFSTSHGILKSWIEENETELFALTAREAVTGELLNSVFDIKTPSDLFDIRRIVIEADTIGDHVANANKLQDKIDTFLTERDAWWDDMLIAQMIELGQTTGNIMRHPVSLKDGTYSQGNFYTAHFGGLYVFRDADISTVIARDPDVDLSGLPVDQVFSFNDRAGIARFLHDLGLAELIVAARERNVSEIIRQKIDFITIATAAENGEDLTGLHRQNIRNIERKYVSKMPEAYHGLTDIWRWATMGGNFPNLTSENEAYFYALRASRHGDKDLVNMLLADLSPLDFRQLFICHKDAFYKRYNTWPETKKDYVSTFLAEEYVVDKAGAREALFGAEPSMTGRAPGNRDDYLSADTIALVEPQRSRKRKKDDDDDDDDDKRRRSKRRDDDDDYKRGESPLHPRRKSKKDNRRKDSRSERERARDRAEKNRRDLEDIRWLRDNWKD